MWLARLGSKWIQQFEQQQWQTRMFAILSCWGCMSCMASSSLLALGFAQEGTLVSSNLTPWQNELPPLTHSTHTHPEQLCAITSTSTMREHKWRGGASPTAFPPPASILCLCIWRARVPCSLIYLFFPAHKQREVEVPNPGLNNPSPLHPSPKNKQEAAVVTAWEQLDPLCSYSLVPLCFCQQGNFIRNTRGLSCLLLLLYFHPQRRWDVLCLLLILPGKHQGAPLCCLHRLSSH